MAQEKKIILFLSYFDQAKLNNDPDPYICPNGEPVYGLQTNEAPVQYLLRENPDVSEILCLVTPAADKTAWNQFHSTIQNFLKAANRKVKFTRIPLDNDTPIQKILPDILNRTNTGDKILLETTGGFRNAMMYLLLISRALSYKGVKTTYAVYSNYQQGRKPNKKVDEKQKEKQNEEQKEVLNQKPNKVEDISDMLRVFDLIDGMQNLTSFGNVRKLQEYYKDSKDEKINTLLAEANRLWECITLCRSNLVPECLQSFNDALTDAETCDDPLLKALLPAFQDKFGKRMTLITLIDWCVKSDMIQQALTLYRERIPAYIMDDQTGILAVNPQTASLDMTRYIYRRHGTEKEARFHEQFLKMGYNYYKSNQEEAKYTNEKKQVGDYLITLKCFKQALSKSEIFNPLCTPEQLYTITMDYLYIRALRNMVNHATDETEEDQQALNSYLNKQSPEKYKLPETTNVEDVRNAILNGLDNLLAVQPQTP